ncbi:MAG TPA: shikimate dehydrogenase [Acidimicrobiales bacterium]|nr:shikimate dehydrogenase [Acidimicrobiales bacterium]
MILPRGSTRVAAVIGDPIRHSLSPVLHNAAFDALGIDWVYVAFRVRRGQAGSAVEAMRTLDLGGLSVTMPHKAEAARAVDRLGPVAARLGVANTVSWSGHAGDTALVGESTDPGGLIDALADDGVDPAGRSCVVLGAGGAARAATLALADAGARSVTVVGRRAEAARDCAFLAGRAGRPVEGADMEGLRDSITDADVVVNATPAGMEGQPPLPFGLDPRWFGPHHFVADLVYAPAVTDLMVAARDRGATAVNGLGMLIHQAGRQLELWTGRPAPLEAMTAAAGEALGPHRQ